MYDSGWYKIVNDNYTGYNSSDNPVVISTAGQLASFSKLVNGGKNFSGKTVKLTASLDLSAYLWTPIGTMDETAAQATLSAVL